MKKVYIFAKNLIKKLVTKLSIKKLLTLKHIIIMENYTEEQVSKMSLSEVVNLLNEQQSQIVMYREASEYRGQQLRAIEEKVNIVKSIINL